MKVLLVSEFTGLGSTGYSNYYKEIANALTDSGLNVVELASYGDNNDPDHIGYKRNCKWKVILNQPHKRHQQDVARYEHREEATGDAKFGSWAFDVICAQEHPDIVVAVRDHWYDKFIIDSPASKYYVSVLSPTVDSRPQKADWLDTFSRTDIITTYNQWSEDWLRQQYHCRNMVPHISPCAADEYKILDKSLCRKQLGIPSNIRLVGTVMRNQKRKKFSELFKAVSKVKDLYLYCHTAYPDKGWDIPDLILKNNIQDRVYITYMCESCDYFTASLFSTRAPRCIHCKSMMETPNSRKGLDNKSLCQIYNTFDLYIQPHIAEGFGIPVIEAAKCGVRCVSTDYSAQEDIIRKVGGIPLKPLSLETEIETGCERATIDVDELIRLLSDDNNYMYNKKDIAALYEKNYNWSVTSKKWVDLISGIKPKNIWNTKPEIIKPLEFNELKKLNLPNSEYVLACILYVAYREDLLGSYLHVDALDCLNAGKQVFKNKNDETFIMKIDRNFIYNKFRKIRENINQWESNREKIRELFLMNQNSQKKNIR